LASAPGFLGLSPTVPLQDVLIALVALLHDASYSVIFGNRRALFLTAAPEAGILPMEGPSETESDRRTAPAPS